MTTPSFKKRVEEILEKFSYYLDQGFSSNEELDENQTLEAILTAVKDCLVPEEKRAGKNGWNLCRKQVLEALDE